jgi:hypothetical protein
MRTAVWLLAVWLLAALLLLAHAGCLPEYLAGAVSGSLVVLGVGSLVRQQLAPSHYNGPAYRSATGSLMTSTNHL